MKQQGKRAYFVFDLLCRYQITSNQITLTGTNIAKRPDKLKHYNRPTQLTTSHNIINNVNTVVAYIVNV